MQINLDVFDRSDAENELVRLQSLLDVAAEGKTPEERGEIYDDFLFEFPEFNLLRDLQSHMTEDDHWDWAVPEHRYPDVFEEVYFDMHRINDRPDWVEIDWTETAYNFPYKKMVTIDGLPYVLFRSIK